MRAIGVIPARYDSTRFPGKALADIGGKSMIERVYERAVLSDALDEVWVATDDERIVKAVAGFVAKAFLTPPSARAGSR